MSKTRSIEVTLPIDADPATVWRALTDARELESWFPVSARVENPGAGGLIELRWDDLEIANTCHIQRWEPGKRLLMTWRDGPDGEHPLPVDIRLDEEGGRTVLRLVHSGFLTDASWDEEFDSHARGWNYELRSLKYYLQRFHGHRRAMVGRRLKIDGDMGAAWQRLVGERGLFRVTGLAALEEGADMVLGLPDGSSTPARLFYQFSDTEFSAIADILEGGIFRFELETFLAQPEIFIWFISWQLAESQVEKLLEAWMPKLVDAVERRS